MKAVGARLPRYDGLAHITGRTAFVDHWPTPPGKGATPERVLRALDAKQAGTDAPRQDGKRLIFDEAISVAMHAHPASKLRTILHA